MSKISVDERWIRFGFWAVVCLVIIAVAMAGAIALVTTAPKADKEEPTKRLPTVLVDVVEVAPFQVAISAQGEARPLQRTSLSAEVGGKLLTVDPDFEAGETFANEALLLQIDPADYQAARASAESALADAKLNLELELVRKTQALRDWAKLGNGEEPSDLVKRVPQLASAQSKVAAAQAALEKAKRDLERTEIRAPYPCRIERTYVDEGAVVAPGMPLVDLVSRGPVEVRLPLSLEDYGYLQRKEDGSVVGEVTAWGKIGGRRKEWQGTLVRSEEIVEQRTRSINVVARFGGGDEPAPPIGMFVNAMIVGKTIPDVVKVRREAMLNNREVLLVREKNGTDVLEIRKLEVMRTEPEVILVSSGLETGERLVLTPPNAPVAGMEVMVLAENGEETEEGGTAEEDESATGKNDPLP